MVREPLKVFAARTEDKKEFRFHINQLKQFLELLKNNSIDEKLYKIQEAASYEAQAVNIEVKENWTPRDYQEPIIEYLTQATPINKLVGIQTGFGKTASALFALAKIQKRFVIVIKPMYIEKWVEDVLKTYKDFTMDDILVVKGSDQLMALLTLAKEQRLDAKVIILSNSTYRNWLKIYEKYHHESLDLGYDYLPEEFYCALKAGVRLIDEVHQDFHLFYRADLYTHISSSISLSATLVSNDPFIAEMYNVIHPASTRYKDTGLEKYIDSYAIHYRFNRPEKIRTSEYGSTNYSHNAVEASIMRHIPTLNNYFKLLEYCLSISFLKVRREKKRCLIFAYTKELCSLFVDYLRKKYPEFDIRRYVSEDPWENLMEADICVSTLGSAGTAVDIPELTTCILTTAINSIQSNIQSLGRLRKLKDNHPVEFLYYVSEDIPKHIDYHYSKKQMLAQRAKSFRDIYSGIVV